MTHSANEQPENRDNRAGLLLAFLIGIAVAVSLGVALLVTPIVTSVMSIALLVCTVMAWRDRYWSLIGRVHYSLVTAAALAFVWLTNYWKLLGFRL